jgi:transcriptional regulator with XRE-family HTH domain
MYPDKNKISGKALCRLRMVKGMPQKMVATRLNMSQQAYSKIECTRVIRPDIAEEILKALNSNMTELRMIQQVLGSF